MLETLISSFSELSNVHLFMASVLILMICGLGLPLPEEIPLFIAGYTVYTGDVSFMTASVWTVAAIFVGDSTLFWIGRHLGPRIFEKRWFKLLISKRTLRKVNLYLRKYGSGVVFVGRFLAGLRGPIFLMTGVLQMSYRRFILFDGLGAILSAPLIIYLSYFLCREFEGSWDEAHATLTQWEGKFVWLVVVLVLLLVLFLRWRYLVRRKKRTLKA